MTRLNGSELNRLFTEWGIVMKKIFLVAVVSLLVLTASTASAGLRLQNSDEILAEMRANPSNFIQYGAASTGLSLFISKSSLNVEYYAPPNYVISAREVIRFNSGRIDRVEEGIIKDSNIRYKYDYASRKMYMETFDENKNRIWKYLDPATRKTYHDDNFIAAGEYLFYFAYKMSFYDKPVTPAAQNLISR